MDDRKIIAVGRNKTVYREGDLAIKLFGEEYSKADVLNEALNQARAEETELYVPGVLDVKSIDGRWAIVSEYVNGKTFTELFEENRDSIDVFMEKFVDIQLVMHRQTVPLLGKLKDKMARKISETNLEATMRYDLYTRLESLPKHTKLCHGDFCPGNVIMTDDGRPYIIDWAHASKGNASADAARTYLIFWMSGDIKKAEMYLDLFCKKSDTSKQYVERWLPIVSAAESVGCSDKEREFLLGWLNITE